MNSGKPVLRVLVVDDTEAQRDKYVALVMKATSEENAPATLLVTTACGGFDAIEILRACRAQGQPINVLVTDLDMPLINGTELITELRSTGHTPQDLDVILVSTKGSASRSVYDIKSATSTWLAGETNGFDAVYLDDESSDRVEFLEVIYGRLFDRAAEQVRRNQPIVLPGDTVLQSSAASMVPVLALVKKVAPYNVGVLLLGESGTGKKEIARRIHESSRRCSEPFIAVNCGAIVETLFETEMFGCVKAAFTGGIARPGHFRTADKGTLFLDEIGDLPLVQQVKLLLVLENNEVTPVGASISQPVDVRVIAATNRDLLGMARDGKFRDDLLMRLNGFSINLPPLRKRVEDIPAIATALLDKITANLGATGQELNANAIEFLKCLDWRPGNIRGMEKLLEKASIMATSRTITASDLADAAKSESQFPEIDALETVTQRLQHQLFVPVLISLAQKSRRGVTQKEFCKKVLESNPNCAKDLKSLVASFDNHQKEFNCNYCSKLFASVKANQ